MKLNGSVKFEISYPDDKIFIYDGYQSEKKFINYMSGVWNMNINKKTSSGQIMEIVFKR